ILACPVHIKSNFQQSKYAVEMKTFVNLNTMRLSSRKRWFFQRNYVFIYLLPVLVSCGSSHVPATTVSTGKIEVPDWALPGSATHKQVPPPAGFHRPTKTVNKRIGIFEGQSDVGSALVPGSSTYDKNSGKYTIHSAGYNIWYSRDEFRFLWKKMSGDVSLAADITFPDSAGYFDRKAVLMIRQNLDDDSKEAFAGLHGAGLIHLAWRPEKGQNIKDVQVKKKGAVRLGIEKRGSAFAIFVSHNGEPLQQVGEPIQLNLKGPFYVGIGFNSHIPDKVDTGVLANVVLENVAGKVR
ncbi:MAG TPA: hypothetical protein VF610_11570, partial [Segetibacter sp.]